MAATQTPFHCFAMISLELTEEEIALYFHMRDGRLFCGWGIVPYPLPVDNPEMLVSDTLRHFSALTHNIYPSACTTNLRC